MAEFYGPPSMTKCSVIRSRAKSNDTGLYTSVRSVRDLEGDDYCDPHDPCCVRKDPEVFLNQSVLKEASRAIRNCAPKNPLHFEYTILHRMKLRRLLQMAAEKQNNDDLTEEQLEEIRKLEEEEDMTKQRQAKNISHRKENQISKNPEVNPPPPPKPVLIDADHLHKSLEGLTNMALAHEIALNKDFKLKKPSRSSETGEFISPRVQLALDAKEKYWEKVDQIVQKKNYKEWKPVILDLLMTLRTTVLGVIPPHNLQMRERIHLEIDLKRIGKRIDAGTFDLLYYIDFIIDTLAALCCPIRDQDVIVIRDIPSASGRAKKLLELMEEVNLDVANFVLSQSRNHIIQNCVTYERNNFGNYMEKRYKLGSDPICVTRDWIRRHSIPERPYVEAMAHAFNDVLDWAPDTEWPETLTLDWGRFVPIRHEIQRVTLLAVIVEAIYSYALTFLVSDKQRNSLESDRLSALKNLRLLGTLREDLDPIISIGDISNPQKLQEALENGATHAVKVVDEHSAAEFCRGIGENEKNKIRDLVRSFGNISNPARLAYASKVQEWFIELVKSNGMATVQTPHSLNVVGPLIIGPITEVIRLMMYNRSVFDVLYREIFDGNCPPPTVYPSNRDGEETDENAKTVLDANDGNPENMDPNILRIVNKLRRFDGRTMVYRRSRIDPRTKPMFEADGTPIVPPEMQPDYTPKELSAIQQKHLDDFLLATEPTIEKDREGVFAFNNIGEPDWMFGYTTEQLLQIMERENMINANKLRRIKERLQHETLQKRVAENLPVFYKIWGNDVGSLQKEYCRLQRILEKGTMAFPPGATDEATGKREFENQCKEKPVSNNKETASTNEKGERIITSKSGGYRFGSTAALPTCPSAKLNNDAQIDNDFDIILKTLADVKDEVDDYGAGLGDAQGVLPENSNNSEPVQEKPSGRPKRPEPMLQILDLQFRIPKRSTKPVWKRLLGTMEQGQRGRKYSSPFSLARGYMMPQQQRANGNYLPQEYEKGKPMQNNLNTTLPVVMGRSTILTKSKAPQMPGTSEVPLHASHTSSIHRTRRNNSNKNKGSSLPSAKYQTTQDLLRPLPPGLMYRKRQETFSQFKLQ